MTSQKLEMFVELLLRSSMGERSPGQIGRALPDGQVQPFNERRVQCRGVFGVIERVFESSRSSVNGPSFDLDDAIVPSRLEHLAVESCGAENATNDLLVEIESVGDDQGKFREIHPVSNVAQESEGVSVAPPSRHCRWPEPRPDFDRDEDPRWLRFAAGEGANLVDLELLDGESSDRSPVESPAR